MAVHFRVSDLEQEIELFTKLSKDFLQTDATNILRKLKDDLSRGAGGMAPFALIIEKERPLRTICSPRDEQDGYEPRGRRCGLMVVGEISTRWELTPRHAIGKKKNKRAETVAVTGIASTRISLRRVSTENEDVAELARWRMEIASDPAPGCCFHVQVMGEDDDCYFPKALPIPRLPSLIMTPFLAAEFIFGELFQDGWFKHTTRQGNPEVAGWSSLQRKRLETFFQWQLRQLKDPNGGSPLMLLKKAQPGPRVPPADGAITKEALSGIDPVF